MFRAQVEYSLDGGKWELVGPSRGDNDGAGEGWAQSGEVVPLHLEGLSTGPHRALLRAVDGDGLADPQPAEVKWEVGSPLITFARKPPSRVAPGETLGFEMRGGAGPFGVEYSLDGQQWRLGPQHRLPAGAGAAANGGAGTAYGAVEGLLPPPELAKVDISLRSEGKHTVIFRTFDGCGNVGSTLSHVWNTAWLNTYVQGDLRGVVASNAARLRVSSDIPRFSFQHRLDGGGWVDPGRTYLYPEEGELALSDLAEGDHRLEVRAVDAEGRADINGAEFRWQVVTKAPRVAVEVRAAGRRGFRVSWAPDVAVEGLAFQYSVDGGPYAETAAPSVALENLRPGAHTVHVRTKLPTGEVHAEGATVEWAVEEEFPATTISSHPNRFSNSATAEFEFSVSKGNCTIFCSLDGGEPMEVGHHLTLRDLAEGKHHVEVHAVDDAGTRELLTKSYSWTVDRTPPKTVLHLGWSDFLSRDGTFRAAVDVDHADDADAESAVFAYRYRVCGGVGERCTEWAPGPTVQKLGPGYELALAGLSDGRYTVHVEAEDRAGNVDVEGAQFEFTVELGGGGGQRRGCGQQREGGAHRGSGRRGGGAGRGSGKGQGVPWAAVRGCRRGRAQRRPGRERGGQRGGGQRGGCRRRKAPAGGARELGGGRRPAEQGAGGQGEARRGSDGGGRGGGSRGARTGEWGPGSG